MKAVNIYCKNTIVRDFLTILFETKRIAYHVVEEGTIDLPLAYNGPAIVDDNITIYSFQIIMDYIEQRMIDPPLFPLDIKEAALCKMIVQEILNNPEAKDSQEAVKQALKHRKPFVMDKLSAIDIAVAAISNDSEYKKDLRERV